MPLPPPPPLLLLLLLLCYLSAVQMPGSGCRFVLVPWEVKLEVEVEAEVKVEARGDGEGGGEDGDEDENRSKVGRRGVIEDDDLDRGDLPHEYPRWFLRGPDKGSHARIRVEGNGVPNAGRQAQRQKGDKQTGSHWRAASRPKDEMQWLILQECSAPAPPPCLGLDGI
ncbi:uncharacterized protein VDAG_08819 [Verticillium dahliae VdLs.17]|uniref:Uncharacterized protein n=1 Tax=Verticillium dahliae (strain VdLs.17 / ATCC MYA-4575 / FGSC 10137) TaxID=498257 RepID=G2XF87_VERDV|nr:uncharacterized protein VDAG_08819 [Verticillium dahliae VdLs.17]EGY18485.1 hypothetical protein VDAG_08819 [Verticillium dahliae VdLs.17]KAH6688178.1 hypothetical protein EV126DRAFT_485724 [Verticillium dahliae]